ncbi:MAG: L,D-transpeptidase family protein [Pseudomonadota bacterium]
MRPRPAVAHHVLVNHGGRVTIAAMGKTGIKALKREGDNATPRVRIRPVAGLGRAVCPVPIPWRRVRRDDGWCDDLSTTRYNLPVRLPSPLRHETLMREDLLYDHILITDHNQRPRVRGAGSAIFIHVARPAMTPTAGCLAFPAAQWRHGIVPFGDYLVGVDPRPLRAKRSRLRRTP